MIKRILVGSIFGVFGAGALFIVITLLAVVVFPLLVRTEVLLNPPKRDWNPTKVWEEGGDLMIEGLVVKPRECQYLPPPSAENRAGKPFIVISHSEGSGVSWPASEILRPFGPWRVVDAAGQCIKLYQDHRCHPMWTTTVYLGSVGCGESR